MSNSPEDIVKLSNSQVLRFIDELNDAEDYEYRVNSIKRQIKLLKSKQRSIQNGERITQLYKELYSILFQPDYCCIIMDSEKDYDRCNEGFKINGIEYKRLLGTNGGVKKSTIVYINKDLYPEIFKRIENGRNPAIPLVPAKYEAYKALVCSASIPLPTPRIIVVKDCITRFTDDIIRINDGETAGSEPILSYEDGVEIELNDSDGYGFMTPEYSKIANGILNGDPNNTVSGINTRYSFEKGMLYTWDYIDFADKNNCDYIITDAWGHKRDVRDSDVILTTSMLKLWDSYDSFEDYSRNCRENNYRFSATKTAPEELDHVRDMNYQFLQSFEFTDDEIKELCKPTIDEVNDVLGLDYTKSLLYLRGTGTTETEAKNIGDTFIDALMIEPKLINDPFIRKKIFDMIKKRTDDAKKGCIMVDGNFAIISGDPYSLCQSMFGMEVTGLLKRGECYHKYWKDRNTKEIAVFRAPMTCHNNIRKLNISYSNEAEYWYRYIKTCLVLNSWDMTCEATNGSDKDGDMFFSTNNPIILKNVRETRAILCVQRRAEKKVVTEEDLIKANKLSFGDEIGFTTNIVTSMIERQSGFKKGTPEYEMLSYRIMCGQHYQQACIDKAKGIISEALPESWYNNKLNIVKEDDEEDVSAVKSLYYNIAAERKPYFMKYVYPNLKRDFDKYTKNINDKSMRTFGCNISELDIKPDKTEQENNFMSWCERLMPVATNNCIINKICYYLEDEFSNIKASALRKSDQFDYTIMKSNAEYSRYIKDGIKCVYAEYLADMKIIAEKQARENPTAEEISVMREMFLNKFRNRCNLICSNEFILCDILLDLCYTSNKSKQFVWDICAPTIIKNLLSNNNNIIYYPKKDENGTVEYRGNKYILSQTKYEEMISDNNN